MSTDYDHDYSYLNYETHSPFESDSQSEQPLDRLPLPLQIVGFLILICFILPISLMIALFEDMPYVLFGLLIIGLLGYGAYRLLF